MNLPLCIAIATIALPMFGFLFAAVLEWRHARDRGAKRSRMDSLAPIGGEGRGEGVRSTIRLAGTLAPPPRRFRLTLHVSRITLQ